MELCRFSFYKHIGAHFHIALYGLQIHNEVLYITARHIHVSSCVFTLCYIFVHILIMFHSFFNKTMKVLKYFMDNVNGTT